MPDEVLRPSVEQPEGSITTATMIERSIVLLLVIGLLVGVLAVLWPFATAILFGTALAIAT
jgi:hypothetical protein